MQASLSHLLPPASMTTVNKKTKASLGRSSSLRKARRSLLMGTLVGLGTICLETISLETVGFLTFSPSVIAQEPNSKTNKVVWDDGTIDFHAADFPFKHVHGDHGPKLDERALESMTPAQRASYEQKRKEAEASSHENLARAYRFGQVPADDKSDLAEKYRASQKAFQAATTKIISVMNQYSLAFNASAAEFEELDNAWFESLNAAHVARKDWITRGAELYASDMEEYKFVGMALKEMILYDITADRLDAWADVARILLKGDTSKLDRDWMLSMITACLANNEYDEAIQLGGILRTASETDPNQKLESWTLQYMDTFPSMKREWERELEFRKKDADSGQNPVVELVTSKGKVVIELFEDQAPNTVANFIYLIERSYYNRKSFFRVENLTVAQTGCEKNDGSGSAGYTIPGESTEENYRGHFRGSVALALGSTESGPDRNSGSSQFYICYMPLEHLNKEYTVFGRVIEGMENMSLLRHVNLANKEEKEGGANPDLLIRAKVIKKRDHEYRPTPHQGRLFH